MGNDKKKQAKARRDAIAEKLKQISSSTVVHTKQEKLEEDSKLQTKEEIESKFVPIAEDDAVSRRVEQKVLIIASDKNSNKNDDDDSQQQQDQNINNNSSQQQETSQHQQLPSVKSLLSQQKQQQQQISNRQRKQKERPPVSYLKSLLYHTSAPKLPGTTASSSDAAADNGNNSARDDLVDLADVTAPDPEFLMMLKDARNTIPVPIHWRQKSKFMSHTVDRDADSAFEATVMPNWVLAMQINKAWEPGVRAIENFRLENLFKPFVAGHPNPELSHFGDLFFEGKDSRARLRGFKPGQMSQRLRTALEMGSSPSVPPPWLSGMQKIGRLPPSYPSLKIPGVNHPIPEGASYGRGRNQWGEPPRDPLNNNKFLFDGVDRSSASVKNSEEAQFMLASCWGTGSKSLIGRNQNNNNSNSFNDYPCIFTASKEEIEAARFRKQEQELREQEIQQQREQENLMLQRQQQMQQQQYYQQQQQQNYYGQGQQQTNNNNNVVIPQYMLQEAGVTGYSHQHQQNQQQQPQQFGVEVNTAQNLPGMGLVNYNSNNNQQQQYR